MTTEFKGTPGPWEVYEGNVRTENPGRCVARLDWDVRDYIDDENARLIAASPDLLKALAPFASLLDALELQTNGPKKGIWYSCESSVVGVREISIEDFAAARAAIAKALQS